MWLDNPFAPARGSFIIPVEPPLSDPTVGPFLSVDIPCAYLPFVRGALQQLILQASWKVDVVPLLTTQQRMMTLISLLVECGAGPGIPISCGYGFGPANPEGWDVVPSFGDLVPPCGAFTGLGGLFEALSCSEPGGADYWNFLGIFKNFGASAHFTELQFVYNLALGTDNGDLHLVDAFGIELFLAGTSVGSKIIHPTDAATGANQVFDWTLGTPLLADEIRCYGVSGIKNTSPADGVFEITSVGYVGYIGSGTWVC